MNYIFTYLLIGVVFATIMLVVAMVAKMLGCVQTNFKEERVGYNLRVITPVRYLAYVAIWPVWFVSLFFDELVA